MKHIKRRCMLVLSILVCGTMFIAKGDTRTTDQGVVIKSTNLTTSKVIKVPNRASGVSLNGNNDGLNRGGNVFNGGSTNGDKVVQFAYKLIGLPYSWGAAGPKAFDCSGFTMYVYRNMGVSLPHYTGSQFAVGQAVSKGNLRPGDLVFFNTYSSVSHVGIYIGGGNFIHAPGTGSRVTISNLGEGYYSSSYAGARRIVN